MRSGGCGDALRVPVEMSLVALQMLAFFPNANKFQAKAPRGAEGVVLAAGVRRAAGRVAAPEPGWRPLADGQAAAVKRSHIFRDGWAAAFDHCKPLDGAFRSAAMS